MSTKLESAQGPDPEARIAERIRHEREAHGWTLADLALRSGVSKAMISKIERQEASPTATLLVRLAGAFRLTLAELIARAETGTDRLVRAADQARWRDPATGYRRRQVFVHPEHPLELVQVELPAGQKIGFAAHSYARIRQILWMQQGRLVIDEGGVRHELEPGDCFGFGPPADTIFANESDGPCNYVIAVQRI